MYEPSKGDAGPSRPYKNIRYENVAADIEALLEADKRHSEPTRPGQRKKANKRPGAYTRASTTEPA
jgi:hypothetical protein